MGLQAHSFTRRYDYYNSTAEILTIFLLQLRATSYDQNDFTFYSINQDNEYRIGDILTFSNSNNFLCVPGVSTEAAVSFIASLVTFFRENLKI